MICKNCCDTFLEFMAQTQKSVIIINTSLVVTTKKLFLIYPHPKMDLL